MCLALNIYFEARGEPEVGQVAVSHVVITRVNDTSGQWLGDACDVISQPSNDPSKPWLCQFSWTCDGKPDIVKDSDSKAFSKIYELATDIYYGERHFDPTFGANHYVVCGKEKSYHWNMEFITKIGKHCYYKDS